MKLKQITLLAAIAQLLALLSNACNFVTFLGAMPNGQSMASVLITRSTSILAQAMLVCFLFALFSRQKAE